MSKKTIVLADSSYTIRRIVELSFSEEKDIELVTFENSLNLREKLLELQPNVVLVDIKLPEFSGYDVCKFVQETESLKHTSVFLLKGGFEPIDERILKDLRYVDIITKPFDSNALVSNIKKLLDNVDAQVPPAMPDEIPSSLPEDLAEISAMPGGEGEISFSDIKSEIDSEKVLGDEDLGRTPGPYSEEEILPSEEITRAQPEKEDTITPGDDKDAEINPFAEDMAGAQVQEQESTDSLTEEELNIKRNIELQERELDIGSLTVEEMNIKKDIKDRQKQEIAPEGELAVVDKEEAEAPDDTSEMFPESKLDSPDAVLVGEDMGTEEGLEGVESFEQMPMVSEPEPEPGVSVSTGTIQEEPVSEGTEVSAEDDLFAFGPGSEEAQQEPAPVSETPSFKTSKEEEESLFAQEEMPEIKYEQETGTAGMMDVDLDLESQPAAAVEEDQVQAAESFGTRKLEIADKEKEPEPEAELTDFQDAREYEVPPMETEKETPLKMEEAGAPVPGELETPEPAVSTVGIAEAKEEEILRRVEDKMTSAIKEMLWEIVPPIAEKIIKKEIEALKSEAEKSFDK
ncbi:MAG: response regulator [Candidatus Aminicenantes bacterium]|nr:response regulator [Candidatus Aminicenantes bacterium]NIM82636.1 response regulator [Candidatus Aminicenantes bacterium]NIN22004.1 response regulator [Candidatus Aminicenantes bacterium]NIN45766.1 response regulator [Candidatus Aminicenantes bacterium]NIN88604.1 response regulator [Candidatus Aminicenantes bacterium]